MCNAPWTTGCKKHDVEVILVDPKTGKRLDVCHACWGKVPKTWEWGKRRRRMTKEEKKAMAGTWKWDEIIIVHEKEKSDDYIPFGKHAWVRKDAMEEKSIEEIIEEEKKRESKRYGRKRKRKRKRRKKK